MSINDNIQKTFEDFDNKQEKDMFKFSNTTIQKMNQELYNVIKVTLLELSGGDGKIDASDLKKYGRKEKLNEAIIKFISEHYKNFDKEMTSFILNVIEENYYYSLFNFSNNLQELIPPRTNISDMKKEIYQNDDTGISTKDRLNKNKVITITNVLTAINSGIFAGAIVKDTLKKVRNEIEKNANSQQRLFSTKENNARSQTRLNVVQELENKGYNMNKVWVSTLDTHTRKSHKRLDGKTIKPDENFKGEFGSGPAPTQMGDVREDVNCRCRVIFKLSDKNMNEYERKERNPNSGRNEIKQYKTYEEYKKYYKL